MEATTNKYLPIDHEASLLLLALDHTISKMICTSKIEIYFLTVNTHETSDQTLGFLIILTQKNQMPTNCCCLFLTFIFIYL
jgi:hypothetical protein